MDDKHFLKMAISEASKSSSPDGYIVGAVIVKDGRILSKAFSGESEKYTHAEEYAIQKCAEDMTGSTIYTTMEPCDSRRSGKKSCCELIIGRKIKRVVFGILDPDTYIVCRGVEKLTSYEIEVQHIRDLEEECRMLTPNLSFA